MKSLSFLSLILTSICFFPAKTWAYPEYAVRYNVIRCTACHLSPVGGGPKTVYGKNFGAHGFKLNPFLSQDMVGADLRALFYEPEKPTDSKGGAGIMSGSVYGHVAVDEAKKIHAVLEHNIAGFSQAPYRDTYILFKLSPDDQQGHWFDSILVGRFRAPFGLITDEHRTYTRIQTASEWFSFESGILLSGTPTDKVHYDFALVNGDKNNGGTLNTGNAERFGAHLNVRYMPGPILFGSSLSQYDRRPQSDSRQAASLYMITSFGRITNDKVPLSLRLEHVRARNWDDHLAQGFASDQAYVGNLKNSTSYGWLAWADYALTQRFTLVYKYDLLTPDRDYPADLYDRHGLGFRWVIGPNVLIQARTEVARATHPSEKDRKSTYAQNASFAFLQLSF